MSSISSGIDPVVKYQRLSAEYVKIRNQVSVLKTALLEEQSRSSDLQREMTIKVTKLRKTESERDSLAFRNDQLVKRVETLQENLDAQLATFGSAKGKKKHKEANLRLVAETSRIQHQALGGGGPSASDPRTVLEEELERKIAENGELHSKLFDMECRHSEATSELLQRVDELQRENSLLRSSGGQDHQISSNGMPVLTKQGESLNRDSSDVKPIKNATNGKRNGGSASDCSSAGLGEHFPNNTAVSRLVNSSRSSDGKPSDSAISLDSVEAAAENEEMTAKRKLLEEYYMDRISTLTKSLQHATGRATYYKQECEELIKKSILEQKEMENIQKKLREQEDRCALLLETLEATQRSYEEQMRQLHEHMAGQDAKIVAQADQLMQIRPKDGNKAGHAMTENGENNRSEKRTSWFSSSSASNSK